MKKRLQTEVRREQIAEAALSLVLDQGVGALTARKVAELVGVTAPALYRHFKNKAEILSIVFDLVDELSANDFRDARQGSSTPLEILRRLFRLKIDLLQRYRALPIVFLSDLVWFEQPHLGERLRKSHQRDREAITEIIRQGQELGQIRGDIGAQEICNHFIGSFVMPGMMNVRCIAEFDLEKQADANWKLFERSVRC